MYAKIKAARIQAMKDKNAIAKDLYSTLMGEIETEAKKAMTEPTNAIVEKVAKKMAKNINENIKLYNEKGVDASKEATELAIVSEFLPQVLSEDQTREAVSKAISEAGITSVKEQGKVMGALKKEYGNQLDMKLVSQLVRSLLN
jgi:uncharacterized protein YqeY